MLHMIYCNMYVYSSGFREVCPHGALDRETAFEMYAMPRRLSRSTYLYQSINIHDVNVCVTSILIFGQVNIFGVYFAIISMFWQYEYIFYEYILPVNIVWAYFVYFIMGMFWPRDRCCFSFLLSQPTTDPEAFRNVKLFVASSSSPSKWDHHQLSGMQSCLLTRCFVFLTGLLSCSSHFNVWTFCNKYLRPDICHEHNPWRKNLSYGEISNFCTWQMWWI